MLPQAGEYNASYAEKMGGRFYMILQAVLIIFGHHVACAWGFGIIAHHEWHEIVAFLIPQLQFGTLHRIWRTKIHVPNSQTNQWKVNTEIRENP